jgi:hypothetical protein
VFSELPLSARRLVGEEQELFLEIDRMEGEINFRFTLAFPVAVTTAIVVAGLSVPGWTKVLLIGVGVAAGWGLLTDGWRRDVERNDVLIALLDIGRAKSPTFERLASRAAVTADEAGRNVASATS